MDTEKKRSKGVVEYEKHGRIWNQKNHSGSEHKGLESLVKEVLIYFTDTLEAMKDFGNGHKNHWMFWGRKLCLYLLIKEIQGWITNGEIAYTEGNHSLIQQILNKNLFHFR